MAYTKAKPTLIGFELGAVASNSLRCNSANGTNGSKSIKGCKMSNFGIPKFPVGGEPTTYAYDPWVHEAVIELIKEVKMLRMQLDMILETEDTVEDIEIED